jgi:3-deoxy-D-manno-octulosonic-acid transferase
MSNIIVTATYSFFMGMYDAVLPVAAIFNRKAKLLVSGRKETESKLKEYEAGDGCVWVHAASLGEFEQGRPIIEAIKKAKPETRIVLTFYSPSGYEVRKNYKEADMVCYMLSDRRGNAKKFIDAVKPKVAYFVKYEFWHFHLAELKSRNIPLYGVSMIFHKGQPFFSTWGDWFRDMLRAFTHIYVQDEASKKLLDSIGVKDNTVAGDTRFDRVGAIAAAAPRNEIVEKFVGGADMTLVAGSTWPPDEEILIDYMKTAPEGMKFVIAPHETHESRVASLMEKLPLKAERYTKATEAVGEARVLVVDTIGLLSGLYRYAKIAYVGGGFGVGIHNTLEPATFGIPVIFGPNHKKFNEALRLKEIGAGFAVDSSDAYKKVMETLTTDESVRAGAGQAADAYCRDMRGATELIIKETAL